MKRFLMHREPALRIPPIVRRVLSGPGRRLDEPARRRMEGLLGASFADVRIHEGPEAAASADAVGAEAFTSGRHVVFNHGRYAPGSTRGDGLLAHELGHVAEGAAGIHRAPLGTKFTQPKGAKSPYRKLEGHFDGATFTLSGDGAVLFSVPAQSGRPYTVRAADAAACGGAPTDTYLNNPRYVGIADNGPIPEGRFQFTAAQLATFTGAEQLKMITGAAFTDPFGSPLHGGDWGAGRVPLTKIKVVSVPKAMGNTDTRSGFYLHGGSLPGSSGCIDVGNDGVDQLVKALTGYTGRIVITVKYTAAPPSVGALGRALGRFTYPKAKNPTFLDRIKAAAGMEE